MLHFETVEPGTLSLLKELMDLPITYFVDAEDTANPISFKNQSWDKVKSGIQKVVRDYLA